MVSMDLETWKQYYADNLILQYKQKPKAVETINAIVTVNFLCGILNSFKRIWDIDYIKENEKDNSNDVFLDMIGQLLGVDRVYSGLNLKGKYFAIPFSGDDIETPTPIQTGFRFTDKDPKDEGEWFMSSKVDYKLENIDNDKFRKILKIKIFSRTCNNSLYEIQKYLDDNFKGVTVTESYEPINQVIYNTKNEEDFKLLSIMRVKNVLPCVAGVECVINF